MPHRTRPSSPHVAVGATLDAPARVANRPTPRSASRSSGVPARVSSGDKPPTGFAGGSERVHTQRAGAGQLGAIAAALRPVSLPVASSRSTSAPRQRCASRRVRRAHSRSLRFWGGKARRRARWCSAPASHSDSSGRAGHRVGRTGSSKAAVESGPHPHQGGNGAQSRHTRTPAAGCNRRSRRTTRNRAHSRENVVNRIGACIPPSPRPRSAPRSPDRRFSRC